VSYFNTCPVLALSKHLIGTRGTFIITTGIVFESSIYCIYGGIIHYDYQAGTEHLQLQVQLPKLMLTFAYRNLYIALHMALFETAQSYTT
jgi:hypothetical protein